MNVNNLDKSGVTIITLSCDSRSVAFSFDQWNKFMVALMKATYLYIFNVSPEEVINITYKNSDMPFPSTNPSFQAAINTVNKKKK